MRRSIKILKKLGKGLLVVALVLVVVYNIWALILGRSVENKIQAIKDSGKPVSLADIHEAIPREQNAAPLYEKAFSLLNVQNDPDLPDIHYSHVLRPDIRNEEPRVWDVARRVLEQNREVISLVEEAVELPDCRFDHGPTPESRLAMYAKAREVTRLLNTGALVAASDGQMDRAVELLDIGFRHSRILDREQIAIGRMVQHAILVMSSAYLPQVLQQGSINERHARKLYDTLATLDQPQIAEVLEGERAYGLSAMRTQMTRAPRLFRYASELAYLDMAEKHIEAANYLHREAVALGMWQAELSSRFRLTFHRVLADSAERVYRRLIVTRDNDLVRLSGTQTVLALEAYRSRYGEYPADLDELRARLGWEIPYDVFSGKDFVYKPSASGFLLYSIGENLQDNGGDEMKDIAWRLER